jgi:ferredoxin
MIEIEGTIREKVKQLLAEGKVKYFIGYEKGSDILHCTPCFVRKEKDAGKLVWNPFCVNNLTGFLVEDQKRELKKGEEPDTRPIGILLKGCDSKSLVLLLSENIVKREDVVVFGVPCTGTVDPKKVEAILKEKNIAIEDKTDFSYKDAGDSFTFTFGKEKVTVSKAKAAFDKCLDCLTPNTLVYDEFFGENIVKSIERSYKSVEEIEALPLEKRWEFWMEHFARCIRCSACRKICPSCYCKECACDSSETVIMPQTTYQEKENKHVWLERNADLPENIFFHLTRMMHMAGRCINCGECERVCPMNIPLNLLTRKLEKDIKEMFDYETGLDTEAKPLLSIFEEDDPGDFIK